MSNRTSRVLSTLSWTALTVVAVLTVYHFTRGATAVNGLPAGWDDGANAASGNSMHPLQLAAPDLDGKLWRLSEQRGKVVLVNFFATWCPPCRRETPDLVNLANRYRDRGVEFVGVSLDRGDAAKVRAFAEQYHLPYPVLLPPADAGLTQHITSIPVTLLVDRQGHVAKSYLGAVSEDQVSAELATLLAEPAEATPATRPAAATQPAMQPTAAAACPECERAASRHHP